MSGTEGFRVRVAMLGEQGTASWPGGRLIFGEQGHRMRSTRQRDQGPKTCGLSDQWMMFIH